MHIHQRLKPTQKDHSVAISLDGGVLHLRAVSLIGFNRPSREQFQTMIERMLRVMCTAPANGP